MNYIGFISYFFSAILIYTLPRFSHSTRVRDYNKILDRLFLFLSLFLVIILILSYRFIDIPNFPGILLWIMGGAIIYAMVYMIYPSLIYGKKHGVTKYMKGLGIFTLIILPVLLIIDFSPYLLPFSIGTGDYILIFPGFYMVLNLGLIFSLKGKFHDIGNIEEFMNKYSITRRETDVLKLLVKGDSYKLIAFKLNISHSTVKTHVSRLYQKTGTGNKIEIISLLR